MSFDLKIVQGDLNIKDGDLEKTENSDKLTQDILKLLLTPIGSNVFFPWYGSPLSKNMIGMPLDFTFFSTFANSQLQASLERIQTLQQEQSRIGQRVTASELLAAVQGVRIEQNQTDPRYYKIVVKALTKALTSITPTIQFRI